MLNASYIKSEVKVDDPLAREKIRPMQGQSPYIINSGLFYQNDSLKLSFSVMYNIIGKRIAFVGDVDNPHIYEKSRNSLDVTVMKTFYKKIQLKFGIKDILNQPIVYEQYEKVRLSTTPDVEQTRIQTIKSTKPGMQIIFGINVIL